jgi:hypothetical protein
MAFMYGSWGGVFKKQVSGVSLQYKSLVPSSGRRPILSRY